MDAWSVGLIAVIVAGLALIVYGAVSDRRKNARAAREMISPPERPIPHFAPDAPAPQYLSELQARRVGAEPVTTLDAEDRKRLATQLHADSTTRLPVGYASTDFVTDPPTSWAVQVTPWVLVCRDTVGSIRELMAVLEKLMASGRPLVVIAPRLEAEVLATLEVNQIRGLLNLLVVVATEPEQLNVVAAHTGATPLSRADLQSGYLPSGCLGQVGTWVSDPDFSYLIDGTRP